MDKQNKVLKVQNVYFIVTLILTITTIIMLAFYFINNHSANSITIPPIIGKFFAILLYYYYVHFVIGLGILVYLVIKKRTGLRIKLAKIITSILLTPISYCATLVIVMIAVFTS